MENTENKKTTKKKTSTKNKEVEELKAELNKKNEEFDSLKDELSKIKQMLLKKNEDKVTSNIAKNESINRISDTASDEEDINKPLATNELITVISLVNNVLTLSTEQRGGGTIYVFHEFGEQQPIIYGDLIKIIHNQRGFTKDGHFFIASKRFVRTNGLEKYYKKIMSPQKLQTIFSLPQEEVTEIFKNSAKTIQDSIVGMLVDKVVNGEDINGNVMYGIQNNYQGDITKMIKEKKELVKLRAAR